MHFYYIKKGDLYLHIETVQHEDYQDYSDIYAMQQMYFVFKKDKDGAKCFGEKREADTYMAKNSRKLKGAEIKLE